MKQRTNKYFRLIVVALGCVVLVGSGLRLLMAHFNGPRTQPVSTEGNSAQLGARLECPPVNNNELREHNELSTLFLERDLRKFEAMKRLEGATDEPANQIDDLLNMDVPLESLPRVDVDGSPGYVTPRGGGAIKGSH